MLISSQHCKWKLAPPWNQPAGSGKTILHDHKEVHTDKEFRSHCCGTLREVRTVWVCVSRLLRPFQVLLLGSVKAELHSCSLNLH